MSLNFAATPSFFLILHHKLFYMKKLFSSKYSDNGISFALLLLRVTFGAMMMTHGYSKLIAFSKYVNMFIDPFHMGKSVSLGLDIFAELFCGALVVLGLMTRLATIPIIIAMTVALVFAHHGRFLGDGEMATLYLIGFVTLLFTGPGKISVDRMVGK